MRVWPATNFLLPATLVSTVVAVLAITACTVRTPAKPYPPATTRTPSPRTLVFSSAAEVPPFIASQLAVTRPVQPVPATEGADAFSTDRFLQGRTFLFSPDRIGPPPVLREYPVQVEARFLLLTSPPQVITAPVR